MDKTSTSLGDWAFLNWIVKSRKRGVGLIIGSIYIVVAVFETRLLAGPLGALLKKIPNIPTPDWLPSLLQCIALIPLPVACYLVEPPEWLTDKYSLAVDACYQFRTSLTLLVSTWTVFYFVVFLRQTHVINVYWDPWIDLLNNLQGVFLFVSYWILTTKTLANQDSEATKKGSNGPSRSLWSVYSLLLWFVLLFLIADISASPKMDGIYKIRILFQLLSGLWVGVSLALLVGCLEGQYFGQPRKVALLLYLYAALQLAYVGFNIPSVDAQSQSINPAAGISSSTYFLQEFATVTSLPLKLLFIGFWYWVLQNGLLAFYMKKTRQDIDVIPDEWKLFSSQEQLTPLEVPIPPIGEVHVDKVSA